MRNYGLFILSLVAGLSASTAEGLSAFGLPVTTQSQPAAAASATGHSLPYNSTIYVSTPITLASLRRHYEQAAADKTAGDKFYKLLAGYQERDALVLAYKGAAEAIRARDASMFNKLTYVQDAARTFEQAVSIDPRNPEIRFLRFSVESNLPAFLGLSKHVDEDKEIVLKAAMAHPKSGLDSEAFQTVREFMVNRGHATPEQAQRLNKLAE